MRLLNYLFAVSRYVNSEDQVVLIGPTPGVIVPAEEWQKLGPDHKFAVAKLDRCLYLALADGTPGEHVLRIFLIGTTPPEAHEVIPSQLDRDVGQIEFSWPAGHAVYELAPEFQNTVLYIPRPEEHEGRYQSQVKFALKLLIDGEPLAEIPIHVLYDTPLQGG